MERASQRRTKGREQHREKKQAGESRGQRLNPGWLASRTQKQQKWQVWGKDYNGVVQNHSRVITGVAKEARRTDESGAGGSRVSATHP